MFSGCPSVHYVLVFAGVSNKNSIFVMSCFLLFCSKLNNYYEDLETSQPVSSFRGMKILLTDKNCQMFCLPSENVSTLKVNNFLPLGQYKSTDRLPNPICI